MFRPVVAPHRAHGTPEGANESGVGFPLALLEPGCSTFAVADGTSQTLTLELQP